MNTSQTDHIDETDDTFSALSRAVAEGNTEEINRLMALEGEDKKETETVEKVEESEEVEAISDTENTEEDDKSEQPQSETADTETVNKEAAPAASTPAKDTDEIAELKRELHTLRSDAGRMRHVQSRMHQLENELRALRARPNTSTNEQAEVPSKKELPAKLNDKLKQLKEIDPDLAETFELFAGMVQDTERVAKETVVSSITEQNELAFWNSQREELLKAVPQADQIFATPEWKNWKEQLTPGRRALTESGYAVEMVQAIQAFAADMQAIHGKTQSPAHQSASSEGGGPVKTNVDTTQNTEVNEERKRKLASAAVKTPAAKQTSQLDPDAYFSEIYAELRKKNHIG